MDCVKTRRSLTRILGGKFERSFVHEGNSKGGEPVNETIWCCNIGAEGVGFDRVPVVVWHMWSFPRGNRDRGYER